MVHRLIRAGLCAVLLCAFATGALAEPYEQIQDHVIGEVDGLALPMDIFIPTGDKNGLAIVDIASGAWFSDRGKIRDHAMAGMYDVFCSRGYTVFAIRPGSQTKFTALEMAGNVERAIRWVKAHAEDYAIDPERIGLAGASAGGHLATLVAVSPKPGDPDAKDALARQSTNVAAVGVFFPPTNFLEWGDQGEPDFSRIGNILFHGGVDGHDAETIARRAEEISPALRINGATPPFMIYHGDADPLVPLQQSEFLVAKIKETGGHATLEIKPGGGHPWMTIREEVEKMGEWFDGQLKK